MNGKIHGIIAELPSAHALYAAAEKIRDRGFLKWDVFSPFPIHHMDDAMGLKKSPLGYLVFAGGTLGFLTAIALQFIPSSHLYPLIVHGKPVDFFSIPAFFPIIFELTVLFSAFAAVLSLCIFNLLPRWNHPIFNHEPFRKVTSDGFFLVIEARDPQFSIEETPGVLAEVGGTNIALVREDAP